MSKGLRDAVCFIVGLGLIGVGADFEIWAIGFTGAGLLSLSFLSYIN